MLRTLAALLLATAATLLPAPHATAAPVLPACAHEDGNADGQPCTWTDPDTGTGYYVTSEGYR